MNNTNSPLYRSLDLEHNKFVRASAGAGKTFALSKRYSRIIDDFAGRSSGVEQKQWLGVRNILVITFTRKAAAEMATRIYDDLKNLIDGKEIDDLSSQGIELGINLSNASPEYKLWLKASFSDNYISTIDGFCSRILRENAHLLDMDPSFKIQDEFDSRILFDEVLNSFIDELSSDFDPDLKLVVGSASIQKIREYIGYLNKNKVFFSKWIHWIDNSEEREIAESWIESYTPQFDENWMIKELEGILKFGKIGVKDENDKGWAILQNLKGMLERLNNIPEGIGKRHFIITEILPLFRTASNGFYKKVPGAVKRWRDSEECKAFKGAVEDFIQEISSILTEEQIIGTPGKTDFAAIPVLKSLMIISRRFESELSKKKNQLNQMSYNDLLYATLKMLKEHENIRIKYSRKFKHIMVDEFQDTNDLRWEIIRIIAEENGSLRKKGFFIVGDKKQSIYGFQQADVEVMEQAENVLCKDEQDADEVLIDFNSNFRSSDQYIKTAINPLFSKLIPDSSESDTIAPYEVVFEPAEYGPRTGLGESERKRIGDLSGNCLEIRASYTGKDEIDTVQPDEYIPALNAALMVKEMLEWAEGAAIDETPVIAVLLRKFSKIQQYVKIFNRYDIPFEIIGGRGLFEQQEAFDLFHLVSVIVNPYDDYALVGLLRSPFFAAPDTLIHNIFKNKKEDQSVYEFLPYLDNTDRIKSTIDRWIQSSGKYPMDRLLRDILAGDYVELGYHSETFGGQRIANLDRLLNIIHETGMNGMSAVEIYEYLNYRLENLESSPQAELPSSAKVQIMTIHKSKGLQFPIVVLPELNEKVKSDTAVITHGKPDGKTIEVGISLNDKRGDAVKTGFIEAIKNQAKKKSEAEELRLFYVAVTRAKYRVSLLGDVKYKQSQYKNWWNRFIAGPGFFIDSENLNKMDDVRNIEDLSEYDLITRAQLIQKLSGYENTIVEEKNWREPPKHFTFKNFREVTPHIIMNSIPSPDGNSYKSEISNDSDSGMAVGALFHMVMEKEWFDRERYRDEIQDYIDKEFEDVDRKALTDKLDIIIDKYLHSERFRIISSIPAEDKYAEHELIGWLENKDSVLQVSGRADLLYKSEGQWFVLDYKTDAGKDRLETYKIQIRTYLWMLRQLYGIEAQGQIYFANFGETIKVEWSDDYYEKIFPGEDHPFKIYYPHSSTRIKSLESVEKVIEENTGKPLFIINQTKQQALDLYKALLSSGKNLLNPKIKISTYRDMLINHEVAGRKISQSISKLIITRLMTQKEEYNPNRGVIDKINKAILEAEYSQSELTHFTDLQIDYGEFKKEGSLYTNYDVAFDFLNKCDFNGKVVILNGFFNHRPVDFEIIRSIQSRAYKFYFIDNFKNGDLDNQFSIDHDIWYKKALTPPEAGKRKVFICFSVDDEVEKAANFIVNLDNWQDRINSVVIAVTSMERYVPPIKKIFADYGIPTTVAKNEPVIERPVAGLIMNLLLMMDSGGNIKFNDLMSLVLHPLMNPDEGLYKFDQWRRNLGIEYLHQFEKYSEKSIQPRGYIEVFMLVCKKIRKTFEEDIRLGGKKDAFNASDKILQFIEKYKIEEKLQDDPVNLSALSKIKGLLKQIPKSFKIVGLPGGIADLRDEFIEQLKEIEVPTKFQEHGIQVLGTLDTVHLEPDILLVLGLTEDLFPKKTVDNSLMRDNEINNWFIDLGILKRWLELDGEIIFFAPERDEKGEPLQISTFTEYLNEKKTLKFSANTTSKRRHYQSYSGVRIGGIDQREIFKRHNHYLDTDVKSEFRGFVGHSGLNELIFSSTSMDSLLHCPMRYWFERTMKLSKTGFDEEGAIRLSIGNIVHSALEKFGKDGGFSILKNDFLGACSVMNTVVIEALEEYNLNPDLNLANVERYRILREGLKEGSPDNIFVEMLNWNRKLFGDLDAVFFEKAFGESDGHPESWESVELTLEDLRISFRGKIDKIMMSDDGSVVLATDYKTGNIKIKDNLDLWTAQLPLYYLALKRRFPDKKVMLVYEQMKSLRHNQYGVSLVFGDRYNDSGDPPPKFHLHDDNFTHKRSRSKEELSVNVDDIIKHYLYLVKKVLYGEFHIAERELNGKACEYCDFNRICRRDCGVV